MGRKSFWTLSAPGLTLPGMTPAEIEAHVKQQAPLLLRETYSELLEGAAEDLEKFATKVVEIGLQAQLEGVEDAGAVMADQLQALAGVMQIRANQAAWEVASKVTTMFLRSLANLILGARTP